MLLTRSQRLRITESFATDQLSLIQAQVIRFEGALPHVLERYSEPIAEDKIDPKADVSILGAYAPGPIGGKGLKPGVKPEDLR